MPVRPCILPAVEVDVKESWLEPVIRYRNSSLLLMSIVVVRRRKTAFIKSVPCVAYNEMNLVMELDLTHRHGQLIRPRGSLPRPL